ncbi:MAG: excinuclease ABC subunit UvrA [Spirochaetia bacterium]|nr:excinuclease ABC subunit UvrA [Spirochaetia bacterium]
MNKKIIIKGAREHNLKNVNIDFNRDQLVVISGLSGSGKSSLAFDTIFAEGQRRYVESLSAYARQFLGRMEKPDVDYIEGLSPAISIEQKTIQKNPRSTVGTITEIYDYYRLLWARIGHPHCPNCGKEIQEQSVDQILESIVSLGNDEKIMVLAPLVRGRKGEHKGIFTQAKKSGFVRIRINGEIYSLDDEINLDKNKKHDIEIVVDRIKLSDSIRKRLSDSVETALEITDGLVSILHLKNSGKSDIHVFSEKNSCPACGISIPELQPRMFSFNNPYGACPDCHGIGTKTEFDPALLIPDKSKSFNNGAILTSNPEAAWNKSIFKALADHYNFSLDTPFEELPERIQNIILYGSDDTIHIKYNKEKGNRYYEYDSNFKGILHDLKRRYYETNSMAIRQWLQKFMTNSLCHTCNGTRLRKESLAVLVDSYNIHGITQLSVSKSLQIFKNLSLSETEKQICRQILKEILSRLQFLSDVGLGYLTIDRKASSLSGGEAQRIRLATQIGSSLSGVLYVLDEPSIGLHQKDNSKLLETLVKLRDIGNTLIVVEHDEATLRSADYIIDLGPGAGIDGGNVIAKGTPEEIIKNENSITGDYLSGRKWISYPKERRKGNNTQITIHGAVEHNLKKIRVEFPLGLLTVITGVSGSGKSTLLNDILHPAIKHKLYKSNVSIGKHERIEGINNIDKIVNIDQSPIGRTPRSNPATYVGAFTPIRELFSSLPDAKARGYKPGRFSFNVKGGRCENCQGDGTLKIEMHFLPDVYVTCDVCNGKRFNKETLEIRYKGKNIHDILELSVEEARAFFKAIPSVKRKLDTLSSVGLGYIKLGQSALTLSGGEAQRVKLSTELSKRSTGKTLYILDEPTTGLHFEDVKKLLEVLQRLVDKGNTVIIIEHNLDVIKNADYIIDLGPEGGDKGGEVVIAGTPEDVASHPTSHTGKYLKEILSQTFS